MNGPQRKHYDIIVVGSGISGLSLTQLLALRGKKVLLLEKHYYLGGSLTRFRKHGVAFDTGFHFTGGFANEGILHNMLTVLGIRNQIEPIYLDDPKSNRCIFEHDGQIYDLPSGVENLKKTLKEYFPNDTDGIEAYFTLCKKCYVEVMSVGISKDTQVPRKLDEDYRSLADVLDELIKSDNLKGILSNYCMCHGVKPSEVSFANHARVAYGLHEAVVRVKNGGDAFVDAFKKEFQNLDVDVRLQTYITECREIKNREVGYFVLNTGEKVTCDQCVFTVHPKTVLETLPHEHLSKAFIDRVEGFEPSMGFFSLYCLLCSDNPDEPLVPTITSIFPDPDINQLLDPANEKATAIVVLTSNEYVKGKLHKVVTVLESSFFKDVSAWQHTSLKKRGEAYKDYKQGRSNQILKRIINFLPEYKDRLTVVESASMLSYRDYLHSPDGTAYGIKQKMGQINLFGRLPLRNLYASGQNAVLPGMVGAMVSSFIISHTILGNVPADNRQFNIS